MAYAWYSDGSQPMTKKSLKAAVAAKKGIIVKENTPKGSILVKDGTFCVEGPHFPKPHRWYAQVEVKNGKVVKVQ